VFEHVRDASYHWAIVVKGYPFSFVIWGCGGCCWCFLLVSFVLRSFMMPVVYLLFLAMVIIVFHASCSDSSVIGMVKILCMLYMNAGILCSYRCFQENWILV